jgi:hypothetical protein
MNKCVAYVIVPLVDVKYQKLYVEFEVCTTVVMAVTPYTVELGYNVIEGT